MLALIFLGGASFYLFRMLGGAPRLRLRRSHPQHAASNKIEELTEYAGRLRKSNKYTSAEKVYLQILKLDHRHVATYGKLGTLYSAMKNSSDATECFQIATQLAPSGPTYYNLGLAYYENRNPLKAVAAFEKAIMFEPSVQRYVGLAKAFNRTGDTERMLEALEQAARLEPSTKVLWLLADAYDAAKRPELMLETYRRIFAIDPKDKRLKSLPKDVLKTVRTNTASLEKATS